MSRAFLCHSSLDKEFVRAVAKRLTRARIVFDEMSFEPGEDFRVAIRKGLDASSTFVLFASTSSLERSWVKFEIDEAEQRKIKGQLKNVLVFIIDPRVEIRHLPDWMTRAKVVSINRPLEVARVILDNLVGATSSDLFVGREDVMLELARQMIPAGSTPPRVVVASGLQGVGRRTVLRRAFKDNLSLRIGPVITLDDTDATDKIYLSLLDEAMELSSRQDLADAVKRYRSEEIEGKANLIVSEIEKIAADNVAICIIDDGAVVEENGIYKPELALVFQKLSQARNDPYIAMVQRRRPGLTQNRFGDTIVASVPVPPLSLEATRRLFVQSLSNVGVRDGKLEEIDEVVRYLDGYPPAVNLAVDYVKRYGLSSLVADKSSLVDLKVRTFGRFVQKLQLNEKHQLVLRMLGVETSVTLDVLSTMTGLTHDELAPVLNSLVDESIVIQDAGAFTLARPVRDTVFRFFGLIQKDEFSALAERLTAKYWSNESAFPTLDAVDVTIYAIGRSDASSLKEFADIILPSNLLRIAVSAYHDRKWKAAREFAERTLDLDQTNKRAWTILAKALIRLAHEGSVDWARVDAVLDEVRKAGSREYFYLVGFRQWKSGNLGSAVDNYKKAEKSGDTGVSVFRDRAYCLYQLARFDEADKDVKVAIEKHPRNPFILDLATQIAIRRKRFTEAEELLRELESAEPSRESYLHRRSIYHAARRQFQQAIQDADLAILRRPRLHEIFANRVDVLIELSRFDDAEHQLNEMEQEFKGRTVKDVQIGLRCKLAIRRKDWKAADLLWTSLSFKDSPVHRALRLELLKLKLNDSRLGQVEKSEAEAEYSELMKSHDADLAFFLLGGSPDEESESEDEEK